MVVKLRQGDEIMEIKILAHTQKNDNQLNSQDIKNSFDLFSGELAGICYMQSSLDDITNQPDDKKLKRAEMIKQNGHHSVYDHEYLTLYFSDVPKFFAMLLNNEKAYTTSEKSARYTSMNLQGIELELYEKWKKIFTVLINKKYSGQPYFTQKRIEKLAMENARYFTSIYTPTCFAYTVSIRQLNYLYDWFKKVDKNSNQYLQKLLPTINEFCSFLESQNLVNKELYSKAETRNFSLFASKKRKEFFGDVYCTNYYGSFASLAQLQRHRTINYEFSDLPCSCFYIPKIIKENENLRRMWLEDMKKVDSLTPQGKLVQICERSVPENFLLKVNERLCTCAQLEVCEQTKQTLQKYIDNVQDKELKNLLLNYDKGARCKNGYKCASPCKFVEGINLEREI